jgi:hypothetical protein
MTDRPLMKDSKSKFQTGLEDEKMSLTIEAGGKKKMNRYCCDCGREKHPTVDKEAVVNALMTKSPDEQLGGTTYLAFSCNICHDEFLIRTDAGFSTLYNHLEHCYDSTCSGYSLLAMVDSRLKKDNDQTLLTDWSPFETVS